MLFSSSINTQILCLSSDPASLQKKISHTDLLFLISSIFSLLPAILYALTHCGESSPSVTVQIQARDKTSLWCETTERSTLITLALSMNSSIHSLATPFCLEQRTSRFPPIIAVPSPGFRLLSCGKKRRFSIDFSLSLLLPSRSYRWKGGRGEVARNWLSNVGLMTGCRARLCATFIEISSRAGTRVFFFSFFLFSRG